MSGLFSMPMLAFEGISYTAERNAALLFGIAFVVAIIYLLRHPFWGVRLKSLGRMPFAMVFLVITLLFITIAWMDGIAWKDTIPEGKQVPLEAKEPRSMLDRSFAMVVGVPEYEYRARSYSAPMATTEFVDKSIEIKHHHLLGTNKTGYDTLYLILKGIKPAVVIGTLPLVIAIPVALLFGVSAGFFGGRVDDFVVYLYTTLASIPSLLLLIALISALGPGLLQVAFGLGIAGWIGLCRLVRGESLKLREMEYVQAATCLGVSRGKIILRHVIPNLLHIVIITAILAFSGLVLSEAVLAYLGIGLEYSWGGIIDNARAELARTPVIWWNFVFSTLAFFLLVLSVNVVGDVLRDLLDPRTTFED